MDIGSGNSYPSSSLSNFSAHPFEIDGVLCNSMEGFLQSLKFKNPDTQVEVCKLVGLKAKYKGKKKKWWKTQKLYWMGKEYDRSGEEYQELLDRAYNELSKNEGFRKALLATGNSSIRHSIGKKDKTKTVLTESEFTRRLIEIRTRLQKEK